MYIFGRNLDIGFRNGTGIDIEFVDSRPMWVHNHETGEVYTLPFQGTVILLPFIVISYGNVYEEVVIEDE